MKKIFALGASLVLAASLGACGSQSQAEVQTPTVCVQALDSADGLFALTSKVLTDIQSNDQASFEVHMQEFSAKTKVYKQQRDECLAKKV